MKIKISSTVFLLIALLGKSVAQENEIPQQVVEQTIYDPNGYGHLEFVKTIEIPLLNSTNNKVSAVTPLGKGKGFRANDHRNNASDGALAISNSGEIVVANNTSIEYRYKNGDTISPKMNWKELIYNTPYVKNDSIFFSDPRIIYDNKADRFILVILEVKNVSNGPTDNRNNSSKIHVLFSQDNAPASRLWNYYKYKGELGLNNTWIDYPYIGITNHDLFISVNTVRDTAEMISPGLTNYKTINKPVMVLQIAKDSGYAGIIPAPLKVWYNFRAKKTPSSAFETIQSIMPVSNGQGGHLTKGFMVATQQTKANNDFLMYLFTIDSALYLNPKSYKYKAIPLQEEYSEPVAVAQGRSSIDSLDGNDNRIQSGFYLFNRVHVVFQTKKNLPNGNNQNGLQYVRINVLTNASIDTTIYSKSNVTHFCYPAIASSGKDSVSMQVTITYLFAGDTIYPSVGAVSLEYPVSGAKTIGDTINIKNGTSLVSTDPADPCGTIAGAVIRKQRWGDYIGIQRKYKNNGTTCTTRLWAYGMFGNNKNCTIADTNVYGLKRGWFGWVQELGDTCLKANSVSQNYLKNNVLVFPNPTQGVIYIKPPNNTDLYTYCLTNLQGQKVAVLTHIQSLQTLSSLELTNGMYLLRITNLTSNITSYEKIIVNR
jgi:hypothetical protein